MAESVSLISRFSSSAEAAESAMGPLTEAEVSASHEMSFGRYLRRQRVLRGISRDEVIRATKVSSEYLEALESNCFERLPPSTFVVGFLRTLSRYAGLDSDELVNRFLEEARRRGRTEPEMRCAEPEGFLRRHFRKLLVLAGAACLLFLLASPLLAAPFGA